MVTDESGAAIEQYNYAPFGALVGGQGPGVAQPRGYAGKERDLETGNDYFGARYYASQAGRFTTPDPVLDINAALLNPQRWSRYPYVSNNPLRKVDPTGGYEIDVHLHLTGSSLQAVQQETLSHASLGMIRLLWGLTAVTAAVSAYGWWFHFSLGPTHGPGREVGIVLESWRLAHCYSHYGLAMGRDDRETE